MSQATPKVLILPLVAALSFGMGLGLAELTPSGRVTAQNNTVKTLHQLNDDFINISEHVTPAVVSIAMTKRVKAPPRRRMDPYSDPDEFYDFFGIPGPNGTQQPDQDQLQQGVGSGVIVDAAKGYILTNNHVVEEADEIRVNLTDHRSFKATVVGTDPRSDLAVIKLIGASGLKQATLGDSSSLQVGEWVLAIGNPFGLDSTVTAGIISAKGRNQVGVADFEDFLQTDAAINPGNSGGALVNIKGELIGINTAIATRSRGYMGIGFAIPSNMAKQVMQALISKGRVSRSQLGVYIQPLDEAMAQSLGLTNASQGILVSGVNKGSPAEKAGVRKYDIITRLNGQQVNDTNQFRNTIALTSPNSEVALEILRNGQKLEIKAKLTEATGPNQTGSQSQPQDLAPEQDLTVAELSPALRRQFQFQADVTGVVVTHVANDSPAYEKGVRPGDVISELNRKPVTTVAAFNAAYKAIKSGQPVLLAISRQGGSLVVAYSKP
ncbi:MAG TPA: DegQ family serine endoprotease [Candidatus Obscuribacterales bacterium]